MHCKLTGEVPQAVIAYLQRTEGLRLRKANVAYTHENWAAKLRGQPVAVSSDSILQPETDKEFYKGHFASEMIHKAFPKAHGLLVRNIVRASQDLVRILFVCQETS